ncbi:MAG: hypothetical protein ACTS6G_00305 [Candidatus Hodgkinia cicadicola]
MNKFRLLRSLPLELSDESLNNGIRGGSEEVRNEMIKFNEIVRLRKVES